MPTPAFMTIKGSKQGLITAGALSEESVGNAWLPGQKDKVLVQALSHSIALPASTAPGRRMHKPLIITKTIDKASPLLNTALCTNEPLDECRLEIYRTTPEGEQENFYTIILDNATIVAIDLVMPHCQDSANASYTLFERVHFAYKYILWKHETAGTMGLDMWQGTDQ